MVSAMPPKDAVNNADTPVDVEEQLITEKEGSMPVASLGTVKLSDEQPVAVAAGEGKEFSCMSENVLLLTNFYLLQIRLPSTRHIWS